MSVHGLAPSRGWRRPRVRTISVLASALVVTLIGFGWPFVVAQGAPLAGDAFAPLLVGALLVLVVAVVATELADGGMDARTVAMLGLLAALGVAVRAFSPAVAGIEPTFALVVLVARAFGPRFGFAYGTVLIAVSALLTAGVGPWLPFQMLATSWLGAAVGALPGIPVGSRAERWLLAAVTMPLALVYGAALDLSFWPLSTVLAPGLAYVPGASVAVNLGHFAVFYVATSLAWDVARGVVGVLLVVLAGPSVLAALRRAARRARFRQAPVEGVPAVSRPGGTVEPVR